MIDLRAVIQIDEEDVVFFIVVFGSILKLIDMLFGSSFPCSTANSYRIAHGRCSTLQYS